MITYTRKRGLSLVLVLAFLCGLIAQGALALDSTDPIANGGGLADIETEYDDDDATLTVSIPTQAISAKTNVLPKKAAEDFPDLVAGADDAWRIKEALVTAGGGKLTVLSVLHGYLEAKVGCDDGEWIVVCQRNQAMAYAYSDEAFPGDTKLSLIEGSDFNAADADVWYNILVADQTVYTQNPTIEFFVVDDQEAGNGLIQKIKTGKDYDDLPVLTILVETAGVTFDHQAPTFAPARPKDGTNTELTLIFSEAMDTTVTDTAAIAGITQGETAITAAGISWEDDRSLRISLGEAISLRNGDTVTVTLAPDMFADLFGNTMTTGLTATSPAVIALVDSDPAPAPSAPAHTGEPPEAGESTTVKLEDTTVVDRDFLEAMAGVNTTVTFDMGDGFAWTVNGMDIPTDGLSNLNLGVQVGEDFVPQDLLGLEDSLRELELRLSHNGEFDFRLTLKVEIGQQDAGRWANLFYYNSALGRLEFQEAVRIADDGSAAFGFGHASDYVIAISESKMAPATWSNPFDDVAEDNWFYGHVQYAVENGLFQGTSATTFSPYMPMTRAMLVTVLWRVAGQPEAAGTPAFDDLTEDWYRGAVAWAAEKGIVNGLDATTFGPNVSLTREQLATILYRYAGTPVQAAGALEFSDAEAVSAWAYEAMTWATAQGIMTGRTDGTLDPAGQATRAEVAAMLHRYLEPVR